MRKNTRPQAGFFNSRVFAAFLLCSAGAWLAMLSFATPNPPSATLSTSNRSITYTDTVGSPPNLTGFAFGDPECGPNDSLCSVFYLTIDPSVGTAATGYDPTKYEIAVQWSWAVSTIDNDVFIKDSNGNVIAKNQSTADPSTIILPTTTPPGTYQLVLVLSTGAPQPYTATVDLQPVPGAGASLCDATKTNCAPARFQNFPAGLGQSDDAGEPSVGVDWNPNVSALQHGNVNTGGVAFFTSSNHEWRVNFDDSASPSIYNWEDVSSIFDQQFVLTDPIGWVDHFSSVELGLTYPEPHTPGRVFAMDLIGGQGNSFSGFSDDDGASYLPGGNGGPGQGPDHETLGGGPYAGSPPATKTNPYPNAIYYCSQDIVAEAQCSRSDDGGQTFGPAVLIYNPAQCTGGIHGHVKVASDGTVYVPNSSCGTVGTDGVAVSTDNGVTWTERNVPNSNGQHDPSLGVGMNRVGRPTGQTTPTIYLGYADGNNHPKISVSHDRGVTWSTPIDVGKPFGITNSVFPTVVAGDDNRAAFAFLGTGNPISTDGNSCDPYGATLNCGNIWHLYVATTYDGGTNWITVDATPDDPVQTGVVCLQGTTCLGGRNLLDFIDSTVDSQGRILVGYADGCVNCTNTFGGQSSRAHGTITRQSGGRRLFSHFDPQEPSAPAAPQMVSATLQSNGGGLVTWLQPDNGGSSITSYKVYRGTMSGGETFLASVSGATTTKYFDPSPPTGSVFYYATAVNGVGEGSHSADVALAPPPPCKFNCGNTCTYPYANVAPAGSDSLGDTTGTGAGTIQYVNVGEPFTDCTDNSLTLVMKVASLDPTGTGNPVLPENVEWQILFGITDTNGHAETAYVALDTFSPNTPATPRVSLGRRDPSAATNGTVDTRVCSTSATSTCNLVSLVYTPDGTILIKLKTDSLIAFSAPGSTATGVAFNWDARNAGTLLKAVSGNTYILAGAGAGFLETMQSTTGVDYTRAGNIKCAVTTPTANLTASPTSGPAPLTVNFSGANSTNSVACVPINSYTLNFGDQNVPASTQSSPTFTHIYNNAGTYIAKLSVTDANGTTSTNSAQVAISVASTAKPDLVVSALTSTPSSPFHGSTATLTATVKNQGQGGDSAITQTQFFDGTTSLGRVSTPPLAPGASAQVSLSWTPSKKGNHTIKAKADSTKVVTESNESNNVKKVTVNVQ